MDGETTINITVIIHPLAIIAQNRLGMLLGITPLSGHVMSYWQAEVPGDHVQGWLQTPARTTVGSLCDVNHSTPNRRSHCSTKKSEGYKIKRKPPRGR